MLAPYDGSAISSAKAGTVTVPPGVLLLLSLMAGILFWWLHKYVDRLNTF